MAKLEDLHRIATILIAALVVVAVMDAAEDILAPVVLALTAGVVLSPMSDGWERLGFPAVYAAVSSLLVALAVVAALTLVLYPTVTQLVDQAPKVWLDVQDFVRMLRDMTEGVAKISKDVSDAIGPETPAAATQEGKAEVDLPGLGDAIFLAPAIAGQFLIFAGALFFFLLTRREIYDWIGKLVAPTDRANTARRLREAERRVSRYFMTVTAINAGLGSITAIVLQVMGLPGGLLWGTVAFALNYVLYLGPAMVVLSLLFAGIAAFDGAMAVMPALSFACLNAIEGQFVTPSLVGRQLSVNPLVVFLSLVFGIWLWGPLGGIVAIPLLLWVLVIVDAIPSPAQEAQEAPAG